ncbi:EscC/YscC/HrcC family type III secretion system outer membrane ring protein [Vibrio sp. S4M6]|uniref:EscC/YscC/HrcC family type III secretion system outer membrane ring protein n=1 Tax=Vibrio sinus TaxID=2946865 RepID=UPI002029C258|nr:EscC/YscC/HrcC family type III secretion system outer membrane ring protein [Vibrio sinus]MCL9783831.1 EscC/YscC/HrcC family type III secretion system outer membrane ring protein [Vibrio sinus]
MKRLILFVLCSCFSLMTIAAPIPWHGSDFFMITRGMKLSSLLEAFGANYNVPMIIDPSIQDTYIGRIESESPDKILQHLSSTYSLAYYYDGSSLYIYKSSQIEHQLVSPRYMQATSIAAYLRKMGMASSRYCSFKKVPQVNALEISGVPVCVTRVTQLATSLDEKVLHQAQNKETIRVFPLKYASASDNVYEYRNQQVKVPGVVSVLEKMAQGHSLPIDGKASQASVSGARLPVFSADPRQNAIVVRDRQANMPLYKDLIAQLDKKQTQIQVTVEIIDVDASNINNLGIDWSASAKIGGGRVDFNSGTSTADGGFSTLVNDTGSFLVKLSALEQDSKAKVLSRPSVVTLNNVQAVLDKNVTFYTKVSGEKVANLESVTSGSLLRVTPRLIDDGGSKKILLTLNIQDGRQLAQKTSDLPQVQNSEIATQATLKPGQSLLLGGFVQDEDQVQKNKIPLLGDIPLLGNLFKSESHTKRSVIRLFLIKASPISLG